jgi:conjugal transfer mating pair stabilization protein TraG
MTQDWRSFLRWFMGFVAVYMMMFLPKLDVKVTDSINPALAPATVANVPVGVAILASFSSQVGDYLTSTAETVFGMPNDLRYRTNGMIYGSRLLEASRVVRISQPEFAANLDEFTRQCIFYDILAGKYSLQDLVDSDDIWGFIGSNSPSPVRMTAVKALGVSPVTTTVETCADAYTTMSAQWVAANGPIEIMGLKLGRQIHPKLADTAAKTKILSDLPIAHTYILNGTKSASEIFQQTLMINAFNQASHSFAASTSGGALDVLAQTRADIQTERTYKSVARQAEIYVPVLRNVLEVLFYALFPVIFPLFLLPRSGIRTMEGYATGFFYLQAWGPVYVILHSMMMWQAQSQGTAEARGTSAITIANAAGIGDINSMTGTLAGYLLMSVPFIAAGLAKGAMAISSHAVSFLAPSQHAAEAGAASATTGSFQLDNTSFGTHAYNTFSANKFSSAGDHTSGASAFRTVQSDGSVLTDFGGNNSVLDTRGAVSSLPFGANISRALNSEQSRLAADSFQRGESLSNNAESSFSNARSQFTKLLETTGTSTGTERSSGFGQSQTISTAQSQISDLSSQLQQQFGTTGDAAYKAAVSTYLSKRFGVGGGTNGGSNDQSATKGDKDGKSLLKGRGGIGLNIGAEAGQQKSETESFGASAFSTDSRANSFAEKWAESHNWSEQSEATFRALENSSDSQTRSLAREVQAGLTQSNQFTAQARQYYEQGHRFEEAMSQRANEGSSISNDVTQQMFRFAQDKVSENPAHFAHFNPNNGNDWLAPSNSATGRQRDMLIDAFFNAQMSGQALPSLPDRNSAVYEGTPLDRHNIPSRNRLIEPGVRSPADVQNLSTAGQRDIARQAPAPVSGFTPATIAVGRAQVQDEALSGADVHSGVIQQQREKLSRDVGHVDPNPLNTMKNAGFPNFDTGGSSNQSDQKK